MAGRDIEKFDANEFDELLLYEGSEGVSADEKMKSALTPDKNVKSGRKRKVVEIESDTDVDHDDQDDGSSRYTESRTHSASVSKQKLRPHSQTKFDKLKKYKIPKKNEEKMEEDLASLIHEADEDSDMLEEGELSFSDIEQEYELDEQLGPKIGERLEKFMKTLISNRLTEDKMKQKMEKYKQPANCKLNVPRVNPELWSKLEFKTKQEDLGLQRVQKALIKSTIAVINTCDIMRQNPSKTNKMMLPILIDAISMNLKTCHDLSIERRRRIVNAPNINKQYKQLASGDIPVSDLLWDDLKSALASLNSSSKLGMLITQSSKGQKYFPYQPQYQYNQRGAKNWRHHYQRNYYQGATRRQIRGQRIRGRGRGWQAVMPGQTLPMV